MRTLLGLLAAAVIAITTTPVVSPASAQVTIETPGGGVSVGPRPRYREREYYERRRGYRDRGCRTITIRRDDGSVRRVRRCD
jgi:hypothetical protein